MVLLFHYLRVTFTEYREASNLPALPDKTGGLMSRTSSERKLIKEKRTSFLETHQRTQRSGSIASNRASIIRRSATQDSLMMMMGCSVCHSKLSKGKVA